MPPAKTGPTNLMAKKMKRRLALLPLSLTIKSLILKLQKKKLKRLWLLPRRIMALLKNALETQMAIL